MAAAVAGTIGQLAKPLTSAIGGKGIDLRAAVRSGGMPSTHSSVRNASSFFFLWLSLIYFPLILQFLRLNCGILVNCAWIFLGRHCCGYFAWAGEVVM